MMTMMTTAIDYDDADDNDDVYDDDDACAFVVKVVCMILMWH